MEALSAVGLERWAHHTPAELSGGQQQRVAIARAIAGRPKVLLADEPTGNLDSVRSKEIMEMLSTFHHRDGITIVMVTHEADMAAYADWQLHFQDGCVTDDIRNGGDA
jgi:putative ABC transport system ATP-binding protein